MLDRRYLAKWGTDEKYYELRKKRIKRVSLITNIAYYTACFVWATITMITNSFTIRMTKFVLIAI